MNNKNIVMGGGVLLALVMSVFAVMSSPEAGMPGAPGTPGTPGTPGSPGLGALPGDTITVPQLKIFSDSPVVTVTRATTSTQGASFTLTERDLLYGTIFITANSAITATLPATSTLTSFVREPGARAEVIIASLGSAAITLAAGTGIDLENASSTRSLQNGVTGKLTFIRDATSTDVTVLMDVYDEADGN